MDVAGLLTPLTVSETGSLREGSVQRLVVSAVRTCQFVQSQMALLSNGSTWNKFLGYLSKIGRLSGKKDKTLAQNLQTFLQILLLKMFNENNFLLVC